MHMKRRNGRIYLYRTRWIPKGPDIPHGYSQQEYIGSISADAISLDHEVAQKLSDVEKRMLDERVLRPNRDQRAQEERDRAERATDPIWRIEEARRLLAEAVPLTSAARIPSTRAADVVELANRLQVITPVTHLPNAHSTMSKLLDALKAVQAAAAAVESTAFPAAPKSGFKNTSVYKTWVDLLQAVTDSDVGLRGALKRKGYVQGRGQGD